MVKFVLFIFMTINSGGDLILNRLVRSGSAFYFGHVFFFSLPFFAMRPLQVRASPSGPRRETSPFEPLLEAQQGQLNRPLHRESHGQTVFSLMFINMLVVHSPLVLTGRGKRTMFFLSGWKGGLYKCTTCL